MHAKREMQDNAEVVRSPPKNTPQGQDGTYVKCPFCPSRVLRIDDHLKHNCRNRRMFPCGVDEITTDLKGHRANIMHNDNSDVAETDESDEEEDSDLSDIDIAVTDESEHSISSDLTEMLSSFNSWLKSIAGSCMKDKTAELYTSAIRVMLLALGGTVLSITKISSIADNNGYLEELRSKVKSTTIRAHLCALKKFFTFLLKHPRYGFCKELCEEGIEDVDTWIKGTRRLVLGERHAFRQKEEAIVNQLADILPRYRSFEARQSAITLLDRMNKNTILTRGDFRSIQRYLIIELLLINGQRSGVIRNATCDEFLATTGNTSEGYIMKVTDHKTYAKYGPANLFMEVPLYRHMQIWHTAKGVFFDNLNSPMPCNVFCTDKGKKLPSGYTASELTQAFTAEGHNIIVEGETETVTPTRMRKAHHLLRRAQGSSEINHQEFCAHLTHTPATAEACYDSVNKLHRARTVSRELQANLERHATETITTEQANSQEHSSHGETNDVTPIVFHDPPSDEQLLPLDFSGGHSPAHDTIIAQASVAVNAPEHSSHGETNDGTPIVFHEPSSDKQLLPLEPDFSGGHSPEHDTIIEQARVQERPAEERPLHTESQSQAIPGHFLKKKASEKKHGRRAGFTKQHEQVLFREFPDFMKTGRGSIRDVEDTIVRYNDVKELFAGFTPKQIMDKLRQLRKSL